jgi:hypothetical protein
MNIVPIFYDYYVCNECIKLQVYAHVSNACSYVDKIINSLTKL